MNSKVKVLGHPLHAMLVAFPVSFYTAAFFGYLTYSKSGNPFWFSFALVCNIVGLIAAVIAAIPGTIDLLFAIPKGSEAKKTGVIHFVFNITAMVLFGVCAYLNYFELNYEVPVLNNAILLSGLGFAVTLLAGFYGWTLMQKYHVGVFTADSPHLVRQ